MVATIRHALACLALALSLVGCGTRETAAPQASAKPTWEGTVVVSLLPKTSAVDMTKPLPPAAGAQVTVWETGQTVTTDGKVEAPLTLPLGQSPGYGPNEGVDQPRLIVLYDPIRDLFADYSTKYPPRLDVTVVVTQNEG
jgi:hypothetical protein